MFEIYCVQGGEPDLTTVAKMVLHDWQRGKIPFFVAPPRQEDDDSLEKPVAEGEDSNKKVAALKAIANVIRGEARNEN
ncbi:Nucleolar GTP-binding protein 2 [Euphorbia peplus]|nr:Nucleolar GTP-binding protein 2 [Euphorbia peplus]